MLLACYENGLLNLCFFLPVNSQNVETIVKNRSLQNEKNEWNFLIIICIEHTKKHKNTIFALAFLALITPFNVKNQYG